MEEDFTLPEHTPPYKEYFDSIISEVRRIYTVAQSAREEGYDPTTRVEIPPAHDVAARVEATLEGPAGVAKRIRELQENLSREQVAFAVAKEIAEGTLGDYFDPSLPPEDIDRQDREKAADKAVRVALSILTESITAAPLEGISGVKIRGSGTDLYLALYLAGPIRAAGGTEAAMTVLVADYVRQVLELPAFKATPDEVERYLEEVELYARNVHLQYPVHPEMVRFAAERLPIMLNGEPTEDFEVTGSRDLPRIGEDNRVRGGAVLVLNDGVVGRATKLAKIVNSAGIKGWEWISNLAALTSMESTEKEISPDKMLEPKSDYISDVIAGRPVFAHPSRKGGFRLRYGRSRNTGLAGVGIHPATMFVVEEFLAPGTHIRTERPGKGAIVAPVDTIDGPIILLKDGTVKRVTDVDEAHELEGRIERIISLGDVLVGLGEFLENNHPLVPSGYCEEWWSHDLDDAMARHSMAQLDEILSKIGLSRSELNAMVESPLTRIPSARDALYLSKKIGIPLHPHYLYRWSVLSKDEAEKLRKWVLSENRITEETERRQVLLPMDVAFKSLLERVGIPHRVSSDRKSLIVTDNPETFLVQLGSKRKKPRGENALEILNSVSEVVVKDKVGFSIGARMGRPEKAQERKMKPPVQVLFPVGRSMGTERVIEKVLASIESQTTLVSRTCPYCGEKGFSESRCPRCRKRVDSGGAEIEIVARVCPKCGVELFESRCPTCDEHAALNPSCGKEGCNEPVDLSTGQCKEKHVAEPCYTKRWPLETIKGVMERVKKDIDEFEAHGVRGVLGLTNSMKIPEYLGKGILRAKHDVYCYRDGTARFDATDAPLTHFTPREIDVPMAKLREMGYLSDYLGEDLKHPDQIVELRVQDIIVPENCADYLLRVGRFVDDCLEKIYDLDRYYEFETQDDLLGHLVIGLAPHTSAGIIGRIVGFTSASVCYAHPYWHAAKRRNCDGDEDALLLVMDALLNFSKHYLPSGRGRFMDAPLVLSVILNPNEVDDESHNLEVCKRYPAEFYHLAEEARHPKEVEKLVDIVKSRLDTFAQYEGFGFTHNTSSIDRGPHNSRYKLLPTMDEKLGAQLRLARTIDAVDSQDVATRVLMRHFFRDIRGNLRAYSTQKFRCLSCNESYRRIPLSGKCRECGSTKISLTVRKSNISKYLEVTEKIIRENGLDEFLQERLTLIRLSMESLFTSEQTTLADFIDD